MLYCINCKVRISTKTDQCPLCHQSLPDSPDQDLVQTFPAFSHLKKKSGSRVHAASYAAVILILIFVNLSHLSWVFSYIMPIIFSCFIITLNIIIITKGNIRDFFKYQLSLCIICLITSLFAFCSGVQPLYPNIIAVICSLLTLTGQFIFARNTVISELKKIFYL